MHEADSPRPGALGHPQRLIAEPSPASGPILMPRRNWPTGWGSNRVLIHPSVMLANLGAIPGLVGRQDAVVLDEHAHSSMQEAAKIARANGAKVATFAHSDPGSLEETLAGLRPYRCALVCIDGVYSMSGKVPPMAELNESRKAHDAVLYIDDATAPAFWASRAGELCSKRWAAMRTLSCRVALQGILLRRRLHRLSRTVSTTAQDPVQSLRLRRAGRPLLSRCHHHRC